MSRVQLKGFQVRRIIIVCVTSYLQLHKTCFAHLSLNQFEFDLHFSCSFACNGSNMVSRKRRPVKLKLKRRRWKVNFTSSNSSSSSHNGDQESQHKGFCFLQSSSDIKIISVQSDV